MQPKWSEINSTFPEILTNHFVNPSSIHRLASNHFETRLIHTKYLLPARYRATRAELPPSDCVSRKEIGHWDTKLHFRSKRDAKLYFRSKRGTKLHFRSKRGTKLHFRSKRRQNYIFVASGVQNYTFVASGLQNYIFVASGYKITLS